MIKVSVISPIYKVEHFIERAAESMLSQTLDDVEFIFVDDCTNDGSINVLQRIIDAHPKRKRQVRILRHEVNRGLPAARNTGLSEANGDFVFHWDSDDYANAEMLEEMYNTALRFHADIVWTDWYLTFASKERRMVQPSYDTPLDAIKGMLGGNMKYNVWNKLVRRNLYDGVRFPEGYGMGEDLTMILVFSKAKKVVHLPQAFYHYLKINADAFSNQVKPEHFKSLMRNIEWVSCEIRKKYGNRLDSEIARLKLESKYPLVACTGRISMYRLWNEWFPEANDYVDMQGGLRKWILQKSAMYKQYWLLWLHYVLVLKIIYGVIYR